VALLAVPNTGPEGEAVDPVDLTEKVDRSGRLTWEIPPGDWTLFRFVCAGTGQTLEIPSPNSDGLIVDHMSADATDRHFDVMLGRLFRDGKKPEALKSLMLDSFEVWEAPDWTPNFVDEFHDAFGYDPRPWLPVLAGPTVQSAELSERFLHDYRVLVSRLMIRNHFARSAEILEKHDLELLAEAGHGGYPRVDTLEALGSSHIPMGEFWNGSQFWVTKEAASAAHIYGLQEVAAESLTGWRHWQDGPAEYKRLFDIAFCAGLNSGVFHTFAHNPPEAGKPGYGYHAGEHFNVNSTWWEQSGPMLEYLSRCSHLLRQGRFVGDVCFYYGDQAPNLVPARRIDPKVTPPHDEGECQHCGRPMPNRIESLGAGYDFDYVNRDIVIRDMQVRDGRLVLSSGMEYRMIVLPDQDDIALPVLRKLEQLVRDGATLVGRPPQRANSLENYPHCDEEVRLLSHLLWGDGSSESARRHGKGRVFPEVALRGVLSGMGLGPDFSVESPATHDLDYIHRRLHPPPDRERRDLLCGQQRRRAGRGRVLVSGCGKLETISVERRGRQYHAVPGLSIQKRRNTHAAETRADFFGVCCLQDWGSCQRRGRSYDEQPSVSDCRNLRSPARHRSGRSLDTRVSRWARRTGLHRTGCVEMVD
jgi:hypothetical protein